MTVKLAILKSGEEIISDVQEGIVDDKVVTYIFRQPYKVVLKGSYKIFNDDEEPVDRVSISLSSWPILSEDNVVPVIPDFVVTIVEPKSELKKMYNEQVLKNGKEDNQSFSSNESSVTNQSD